MFADLVFYTKILKQFRIYSPKEKEYSTEAYWLVRRMLSHCNEECLSTESWF